MDENKEHTGGRNGNKWNPIIVAVIGGILGSGGAISVVFSTPVGESLVRPDPFTATQAAALEQRITHLELDTGNHINSHPDVVNRFDRRITVLETQYSNILSNQVRIIEQLDRLNRAQ